MKIPRRIVALITATLLGSVGFTGCKQEPAERTSAEAQVDSQLAEQVKLSLVKSPAFKFPDVQVASFKGRVQLSGFVQSDDQKSAAASAAKAIPGVVEVENRISLKK